MPDQVIPINDLVAHGLNEDSIAASLPPNAFSDLQNVRFNDGAVRKFAGEEVINFATSLSDIVYIAYWRRPSRGASYVILSESSGETVVSVYIINSAGNFEIDQISSANVTGTIPRTGGNWQHTEFNGGFNLVINDGQGTPYYLQEDSVSPLMLPNWDSYQAQETVIDVTFGGSDVDADFPLNILTEDLAASSTATSGIEVVVSIIPRNTSSAITNGVFYDDTRTVADVGTLSGAGTTQLEFNPSGANNGDRVVIILRQVPSISVTAGVVRAYGNTLVAGCLQEVDADSNIIRDMPGTIRTSDVAAPGEVPANWNPFRTGVNTADEFVLSSTGKVVDLVELQGAMYIYTSNSIHILRRSNNPNIPFNSAVVTDSYGASNIGSIIEKDGVHIVVGNDDVYQFSGQPAAITSIADTRVRNGVVAKSEVVIHRFNKYDELWFVTPQDSEMYVYNYRLNVWTKRRQRLPLVGNPTDNNLIFVGYNSVSSTSGDVYTVDTGFSSEVAYISRTKTTITPEFDTESLRAISFIAEGNGRFACDVVASDSPATTDVFVGLDELSTISQVFNIDTGYKADFRINGRYLSYRFSHLVELVAGTESFTGDGAEGSFTLTTTGFQDLSISIDGNSEDDESLSQAFTGDGTTLAFTIDNDNNRDVSDVTARVGGAAVESTDYTVSGKTVTFNTAPDDGDTVNILYTASIEYTISGQVITFTTVPANDADVVASFNTEDDQGFSLSGMQLDATKSGRR